MQALLRHERGSSSRGGNLVVTAAAGGASNGTATNPFTVHYFPQELDHFTFTPNASMLFYQKYLVNDTFWRRPGGGKGAAGPLFVYTGNEGDIEWFATNTGFMFDIAPKFGALLVFIEVQRILITNDTQYTERSKNVEFNHHRPQCLTSKHDLFFLKFSSMILA